MRPSATVQDPEVERHVERLLFGSEERSLEARATSQRIQRLVHDLTVSELRGWLVRAEGCAGPDLRPMLRRLRKGQRGHVPVYQIPQVGHGIIRPGQVELSWDHVRDKVADLARRAAEGSVLSGVQSDDFPVVVGPGGRFLTLLDGHHKLASLLLISELVERLCQGARLRNPVRSQALQAVAQNIPGVTALRIPVRVVGVHRDADEASYLRRLSRPDRGRPPIRLEDRHGRLHGAPPRRFSELADEPFRKLASDLGLKAKVKPQGPTWKGACYPLWLKLPTAPDFVEFTLGRVFARVYQRLDQPYHPQEPVHPSLRESMREELVRVHGDRSDPLHSVVRQVPVVVEPILAEDVAAKVRSVARDRRSKKPPLKLASGAGAIRPPR